MNARATAAPIQGRPQRCDEGLQRRRSRSIREDGRRRFEGRGNVKMAKNDLDGAISDGALRSIHFDGSNLCHRLRRSRQRQDFQGRPRRRHRRFQTGHRHRPETGQRVQRPRLCPPGQRQSRRRDRGLPPRRWNPSFKTAPFVYYNRGLARQSQGNIEAAIVELRPRARVRSRRSRAPTSIAAMPRWPRTIIDFGAISAITRMSHHAQSEERGRLLQARHCAADQAATSTARRQRLAAGARRSIPRWPSPIHSRAIRIS